MPPRREPSSTVPERIGILAGGGRLPAMIADSVLARGGHVHIVGVIGEADDSISRYPHTWVNWAQIGRMLATLRNEGGGQVVIAGGVRRPILSKLRPDLGFFRVLPQLLRMLAGGDDSVLSRVVRVFEHFGVTVRGAHEVAPDLLVGEGVQGRVPASGTALADAAVGLAVRRALADFDAGQAVVTDNGKVLAIEGAEGTDEMLRRVASLGGRALLQTATGVLSKAPKPGQEMRVDMPVIGARTIDGLIAARLAGAVVEPGAVLFLEREEAVRKADAAGIMIAGVRSESLPSAARAHGAGHAGAGRCMGRLQPSKRDLVDIEKGLSAVSRLASLDTGKSVVVSRAYMLAFEAAEGVIAMLARVGSLRQWGLGKKRRVGVLVRRVEAGQADVEPASLLAAVAAQGLAGLAVTGREAAMAGYAHAGPVADGLGIFLVVCARPDAESKA